MNDPDGGLGCGCGCGCLGCLVEVAAGLALLVLIKWLGGVLTT